MDQQMPGPMPMRPPMPTMPMQMAEMHRRLAMAMMEKWWHSQHYKSRNFHHYVVQPGDTKSAVAERFTIRRDLLDQWNCLPGGDALIPGTMLTFPCEHVQV